MNDDTVKTVSRAIENIAAGVELEAFNFEEVQVPKRTNDPELRIKGGTTFAEPNTEAIRLLKGATSSKAVDAVLPRYLALHQVKGNPQQLVATPVAKAAENTVPVTWGHQSDRCRINFRKLFLIRSFNIGKRSTAHIPVSLETIESLGPSLVLYLDRIYTVPLTARPRSTAQTRTE